MAAKANGDPIFAIDGKAIYGSGIYLVGFGLCCAQQICDLLSRVVLLGNNQFHAVPPFLPGFKPSRYSHGLTPICLLTCAGICSFVWQCFPSTAFAMRQNSAAPTTPGAPLLRSKIQHTRIEKLEAKNLITYPHSSAERPTGEARG